MAHLEASALITVPRHLHLSNQAAVADVCRHLRSSARRDAFAEQLRPHQQVACSLAAKRARGSASSWAPYIRSLPGLPPNPWLLSGAALTEAAEAAAAAARGRAAAAAVEVADAEAAARQAELDAGEDEVLAAAAAAAAAYTGGADGAPGVGEAASGGYGGVAGSSRSGSPLGASTAPAAAAAAVAAPAAWRAAAVAAAARYGELAVEALDVLGGGGELVGGGLQREDLMWALGQVASRSLGSGNSAGMLPYIDLCNHHPDARPPMMMLDEQDQIVFALTSMRDGELAPMAAGQELFINYHAEEMTPLRAWLKWGFVPAHVRGSALSER